ncbi:MAG: hypothetical protein R2710_26310 [Acidimicrobiales bacterium]
MTGLDQLASEGSHPVSLAPSCITCLSALAIATASDGGTDKVAALSRCSSSPGVDVATTGRPMACASQRPFNPAPNVNSGLQRYRNDGGPSHERAATPLRARRSELHVRGRR